MTETSKMMRYEANKKSVGLAYLAWLFLGFFCAHKFYAGRTKEARNQLLVVGGLAVLGFIFVAFPVNKAHGIVNVGTALFYGAFFCHAFLTMFDIFRIPRMVRDANNDLAESLGM